MEQIAKKKEETTHLISHPKCDVLKSGVRTSTAALDIKKNYLKMKENRANTEQCGTFQTAKENNLLSWMVNEQINIFKQALQLRGYDFFLPVFQRF